MNNNRNAYNNDKFHILIVDDYEKIIEIDKKLIESQGQGFEFKKRNGCIVDGATHAETALKKIFVGNYDLVITDLGLPNISGYELIERVRKASFSLPFIIKSGILGTNFELEYFLKKHKSVYYFFRNYEKQDFIRLINLALMLGEYDKAIMLNITDSKTWRNKIEYLFCENYYDMALDVTNEYIGLNPYDKKISQFKITILRILGRFKEALQLCDHHIKLDQYDIYALDEKRKCLMEIGSKKANEEVLIKIKNLDQNKKDI